MESNHLKKQILLINDLAGHGKVALSAMMPVLSHMGHHIYTLPTALVSNTLDYGKNVGGHRGHKPGDSFDFDTERGKLCPMVMHVS